MTSSETRTYDFLEELDENQKEAVTSSINSVISAGAGSGKTKVLATRFLYLVVEKKLPVESILTVTFTQKAATEMYSRIYNSLAKSSFPEAQEAIANFHKAQISTIDSFCTRIARQTSRFFGIAPDFVLEDDNSISKAQELALPFLLENRNTEGVKLLLKDTTVAKLSADLFDSFFSKKIAITRPVDFVKTFNNQVKGINEVWDFAIKKTKDFVKTLQGLKGRTNSEISFIQKAKEITIFPKLFVDKIKDSNDYIKTEISPEADKFIEQFSALASISKFKGTPKESDEEIIQEIQDNIKNRLHITTKKDIIFNEGLYKECRIMLMTASVLPQTIEVFKTLDNFQKLYIQEKINSKRLSFNDISTMAVDGLLIDKNLRNTLKNNFKSIMIDEFQDDNQLQRDLLFLIAEKPNHSSDSIPESKDLVSDKLFFVGDEKQSIYRFRGADVSVFRNLTKTLLQDTSIEMPRLEINYRTQPKILHFFNSIFPSVFKMKPKEESNPKKDFEADFFPINIPEKTVQKGADAFSPKIEIINISKNEEEDDAASLKEKEALCVSNKILELIQEKTLVWDKEKKISRPCEFSDFAILFRATTRQSYFESSLKKFNIPFIAENQKSLFEDSIVIDILNFLKLAVYSQDRMAYAIVLRSPFVRISDAGFLTLMEYTLNEKGYPDTRILTDPFTVENPNLLSEEDKEKLNEGRKLFLTLQSKIDREPVSDLISFLWYNYGYRYNVIVKQNLQPYQELFDFLYFLALQADKNNLQLTDFITMLTNQINENSNLQNLSIPRENQGGVKLLTIHKSKGLEFPIVFLVDCSAHLKPTKNSYPYYISSKWGLTVNIESSKGKENWFYNSGLIEEKEKEAAEHQRLLYVAATRAESHLLFFTTEDLEKSTNSFHIIKRESEGKVKSKPKDMNSFSLYLSEAFGEAKEDISLANEKPILYTEFNIDLEENNSLKFLAKEYQPKKTERTEEKTTNVYTEEAYNSAQIREPLFIKPPKLTPSYFKEEIVKTKLSFPPEIDTEEIELLQDAKLEATDFGTLTHLCIQNKIEHQKFELPENYKKKFSSVQKAEKFIEKIENLANNFLNSDFAKQLNETEFTYCEFPFMTKYKTDVEHIFSGTMDLVFLPKNSEKIILVDFKTDKAQIPEIHRMQLKIYKKASEEIWGKPVKSYLFYLRTGKEVEI